jgi:hypothetical protein
VSRSAEIHAAVLSLVRVQGVEEVFDGAPVADMPPTPSVALLGEREERRVENFRQFEVQTECVLLIESRSGDTAEAVRVAQEIFDRIEVAIGADPRLGLGADKVHRAYITAKESDHGATLAGSAFVQFTLEVTYRRPVGTP